MPVQFPRVAGYRKEMSLFLEKYPVPVLPAMGIFSNVVVNGLSWGAQYLKLHRSASVTVMRLPCPNCCSSGVWCFSPRSSEFLHVSVLPLCTHYEAGETNGKL